MISEDGTTNQYQSGYLQERSQAYQDAYADGEFIIAWVGGIICGAGRWLVAWRQRLQPRQQPSAGISEGKINRKGADDEVQRRILV